jgi:hypothetical protein
VTVTGILIRYRDNEPKRIRCKEQYMPSPATTDLPRPKSWDEFEDICADVLKRVWDDPYITRNGRSGQRQQGVDIYGLPRHLGGPASKNYAGAQCKETDALTFEVIDAEATKAKGFKPTLTEYMMMTTAPRDSSLQEAVRTATWPFSRMHVWFWEDISLELSGHDDLLQKHFPGWMKRTTTEEQVMNLVLSSQPDDFKYDDGTGVFFHRSDVLLHIAFERGEQSDEPFEEPWVANFPDSRGTRQPVYIQYAGTRVREVLCVYVDGGRYVIPAPNSATDLTLGRFRYHLGRILNYPFPGYGFDYALERAGITVNEALAD